MKNIAIYIHIPFCTTRCGYCDFLTFDCANNHHHEPYKNALIKEIKTHSWLKHYNITSIFIGGGTPTVLLPSYLEQILHTTHSHGVAPTAEITVEANPETLSKKMLIALKNSGANRLSIGLQTWQNDLLKKIGRAHTLQNFKQGYKTARTLGFDNINVDIMFSLPHAKNERYFSDTLQELVQLEPEHISAYSLSIEEGTPFFFENIPQNPEEDRRMYHFAINYLAKKGYTHYEISNFSKKNKKCQHNILYWQRGEYIGFGLGASSFLNDTRSKNTTDLQAYIKGENVQTHCYITKKDAMSEFMYLGLRLMEGICPHNFFEIFRVPLNEVFGHALKKNIANNLLYKNHNKIALTKQGLNISNRVMADFLLD